jgi:tetratricopeptide (TPR) repeat protein
MGAEHPYTFFSMHTLAVVLTANDKLAEAAEMHRRTFEVRRQVLGPEHPATLVSMDGLAVTLGERGQYEEAERLLRQELRIRRQASGSAPDTAGALHNLALVLQSQQRLSEAEQLFREAHELQVRAFGAAHPDTLSSGHALAEVLLAQDDAPEAEAVLYGLLETAERVLPQGSALRMDLSTTRGRCLTALQRFKEAEQLLLQVHAATETIPHGNGERMRDVITQIIYLYEVWNKPEQAAEYRALLQERMSPSAPEFSEASR